MNNKKKAILYIRVSTDEQADKGYSLAHQQERLELYCKMQGFEVVALYREDHSAKSFERPQFKKLLDTLKRNKNSADLLVFTKWDRFSRNAGDAYGMINTLRKFGVEPQAIEQPLDLTVPENKLMLAFYLAAPEVENDRRALNIIAGIRKAQREGRVCGSAPKGYKNVRNERGIARVDIDEAESKLVIWCFKKILEGNKTSEDIRKEVNSKGFQLSQSHFYRMVRNPFYYGMVHVPKHNEIEDHYVLGQHKPLITKEFFDRVQDVLEGKKRELPSFEYQKEIYPLRGFMQCSLCGATLTASASTGRWGGKFHYYHCRGGCKERLKAEDANDQIEVHIETLNSLRPTVEAIKTMLKVFKDENSNLNTSELKKIEEQMKRFKTRLDNAQSLMLDGELSMGEYKTMKANVEAELNSLNVKKLNLPQNNSDREKFLSFCLDHVESLGTVYSKGTVREKQLLLGSVFEEKLKFPEKKCRTPKFNKVISLLFTIDKGLRRNKKGIEPLKIVQSHKVEASIQKSNFWMADLDAIAQISLEM